jgi:hypothetical protein
MELSLFKQRFRDLRDRYPCSDNAEIARIMGVSERTLRRYFDPDDPSIPDGLAMINLLEHIGADPGVMLFPDRRQPAPAMSALILTRQAILKTLAIILITPDMDVLGCTHLFAGLYDTVPENMTGTNMFKDWSHYAIDNYPWIPKSLGEHRKSQIEILMTMAKENKVSSNLCWFVCPKGNMTWVLMRCFYLDDGNFLFIDIPVDDPSTEFIDKVAVKNDQLVFRVGEWEITLDSQTVYSRFMSGWDITRIAESLKWDRQQVLDTLDTFRQIMGATDLEEMRETLWHWAFDGKAFDQYSMIRANGKALI